MVEPRFILYQVLKTRNEILLEQVNNNNFEP